MTLRSTPSSRSQKGDYVESRSKVGIPLAGGSRSREIAKQAASGMCSDREIPRPSYVSELSTRPGKMRLSMRCTPVIHRTWLKRQPAASNILCPLLSLTLRKVMGSIFVNYRRDDSIGTAIRRVLRDLGTLGRPTVVLDTRIAALNANR
jgi:hypothetical protein